MLYQKINLAKLYEQAQPALDAESEEKTIDPDTQSNVDQIESAPEEDGGKKRVKAKTALYAFEMHDGILADINKLADKGGDWKGKEPLKIMGADGSIGGVAEINGKPVYLWINVSNRKKEQVQLELEDRFYLLWDTNSKNILSAIEDCQGIDNRKRVYVANPFGTEYSLELWCNSETKSDQHNNTSAQPESNGETADIKIDLDAAASAPGTAAGVVGLVAEGIKNFNSLKKKSSPILEAADVRRSYPHNIHHHKVYKDLKAFSNLKNPKVAIYKEKAKIIAGVLHAAKSDSALGNDFEAWFQAAFQQIHCKEHANMVKRYLGMDPMAFTKKYLSQYELSKQHHTGPTIIQSYKRYIKATTISAMGKMRKIVKDGHMERSISKNARAYLDGISGTTWKYRPGTAKKQGLLYAGNIYIKMPKLGVKKYFDCTDISKWSVGAGQDIRLGLINTDFNEFNNNGFFGSHMMLNVPNGKSISLDEFINTHKNWGDSKNNKSKSNDSTGSTGFTKEEGDKFRKWANSTDELRKTVGEDSDFKLDPTGSHDNSYIRKAYAFAKDDYTKWLKNNKSEKEDKTDTKNPYKKGDEVYVQLFKAPGSKSSSKSSLIGNKSSSSIENTYLTSEEVASSLDQFINLNEQHKNVALADYSAKVDYTDTESGSSTKENKEGKVDPTNGKMSIEELEERISQGEWKKGKIEKIISDTEVEVSIDGMEGSLTKKISYLASSSIFNKLTMKNKENKEEDKKEDKKVDKTDTINWAKERKEVKDSKQRVKDARKKVKDSKKKEKLDKKENKNNAKAKKIENKYKKKSEKKKKKLDDKVNKNNAKAKKIENKYKKKSEKVGESKVYSFDEFIKDVNKLN